MPIDPEPTIPPDLADAVEGALRNYEGYLRHFAAGRHELAFGHLRAMRLCEVDFHLAIRGRRASVDTSAGLDSGDGGR